MTDKTASRQRSPIALPSDRFWADRAHAVRWTVVLATVLVTAVGVVALLSGATAAAGPPSTDCVGSDDGALYVTDTDLTVAENDPSIHWGQFPDAESVDFRSVQVAASGPADVRLENGTGERTCLADVNASANDISVTPEGEGSFVFGDRVDAVSFQSPGFTGDDSQVDMAYDAPGTFSVRVPADDVDAGETVRAVTPSGDELDETTVADNGTALFSLPAGDESVTFRVAEGSSVTVTDRQVSPQRVTEGESVDISATVANNGDQRGSTTVTYSVDGAAEGSEDVSLDGGESTTVTFTHTFDSAGSYDIGVNGQRVDTVAVTEPAGVEMQDVTLNRTDVDPEAPIEVTATVTNDGRQAATTDLRLQANGETIQTKSVTVDAGQQQTVTFVHAFDQAGTYDVAVNGHASETVSVGDASFSVSEAELGAETVAVGESIDVTATITNDGTDSGVFDAIVEDDDDQIASKSVGPLAAGESTIVTFTISFEDSGERPISVNGVSAGTLEVEAETSDDDDDNGGGGGGGGGGGSGGGNGGSNGGDTGDDTDDNDSADDDTGDDGSEDTDGGGAVPPSVSRTQVDDGVVVRITDGTTNVTLTQSLNLSGPVGSDRTFTLSALSIRLAQNVDSVNTTLSEPRLSSGTLPAVRDSGVLGYVNASSTANASVVGDVTFAITLSDAVLSAQGGPNDVRVFQYHNGNWTELNGTAAADGTTIRANATRLSPIAVVGPNQSENDTDSGTGDDTDQSAQLSIESVSLATDSVSAGATATVLATVANPTNRAQNETLTVTVAGDTVAEQPVRLEAGEQTDIAIEFDAVAGAVSLNGVEAGELTIDDGDDETDSTADGDGGSESGGQGDSESGGQDSGEDTETVSTEGPGFDIRAFVIALAVVSLLARARRR